MGTNRQIIYNFVLDQIKLKLIKKMSRFVYNNCTYVPNPTLVYKTLQPPVPCALVASVLRGLVCLALVQLSQSAVQGYWLSQC